MEHDGGFYKRAYGAPALQKFMDARAFGKASKDELARLSKAAMDEQAAMATINRDQSFANGKSIDQFLSECRTHCHD
jgi:hypothetical protein